MHALAGTHYIEIGGQKRPLVFDFNQTAKFCEIRGDMELSDYAKIMTESGLAKPNNIRDIIFSALWAGAAVHNLPMDFNQYHVGAWISAAEDPAALFEQVGKAIAGVANPNGKAQEKAKEVAA